MEPDITVCPIPIEETHPDGLEWVDCAECGLRQEGEAWCDGEGGHYCQDCIADLIEEAKTEARRFAEENCAITPPLARYYPEYENRCTPEEYEAGDRDSYTMNSHICWCRHNLSNYDDLIKDLSRQAVIDQVFYLAIRERTNELIKEALEEAARAEDEDDWENEEDDWDE
jgi:hypothetical protein